MLLPWKYVGLDSNMKAGRYTLALIADVSLAIHASFLGLLGSKQFFGTPIRCEVSEINPVPLTVVNDYCWMHGKQQKHIWLMGCPNPSEIEQS